MLLCIYLNNIYFINCSVYTTIFIIKHNKHYCVNICFICVCCYKATCFDPLLGHSQAYAIQASVTAISMNSYCIHAWFLIKHFFFSLWCSQYLIKLKSKLNLIYLVYIKLVLIFIILCSWTCWLLHIHCRYVVDLLWGYCVLRLFMFFVY
jgi:hypothetical protein